MELSITLEEPHRHGGLFGASDRHLRTIRQVFGVQIATRNGVVRLNGSSEAVTRAAAVIQQMQQMLRGSDHLSGKQVSEAIARSAHQEVERGDRIEVFARDHVVVPRTEGQGRYVEAIRQNDLVFCSGPAGTGKTYLAVAMAASLMKQGSARRMVLVRPAVEAGEKLGYLPGDMQAKVNPFLRPLFDALHDMMGYDQIRRFMDNDLIEVVPLAFMRGRTLNKSVVILDEAQNTTVAQMLMFLTRLGHDSKMIVTGDDSQIDLPSSTPSGLVDATRKLKGIKGIAVVRLVEKDIVRHRLVQNIVSAYAEKT